MKGFPQRKEGEDIGDIGDMYIFSYKKGLFLSVAAPLPLPQATCSLFQLQLLIHTLTLNRLAKLRIACYK